MVDLTKEQKRAAKQARRREIEERSCRRGVDVACVIHGRAYDWIYVERLHNMVQRNLSLPVTMHVWTEHDRSVPPHMVKHILEDWPGITGPRKSWWYKLQMFDPTHFQGDLLYFDLDVVICNDISWLLCDNRDCVWTLKDFRYLNNPAFNKMNSSIMWWNTDNMSWIYDEWTKNEPQEWARRYHGDQDFLFSVLNHNQRRYYDTDRIQSWRWSAYDGGWNFQTRRPHTPGAGTKINSKTSVLIFHGRPKPHQITDPIIQQLWK